MNSFNYDNQYVCIICIDSIGILYKIKKNKE